jgi:hypothetical protein
VRARVPLPPFASDVGAPTIVETLPRWHRPYRVDNVGVLGACARGGTVLGTVQPTPGQTRLQVIENNWLLGLDSNQQPSG